MPSQTSGQPGLALPPMRCSDFIEYILLHHTHPSTIVIASTREAFLESMQTSLNAANPDDPSAVSGEVEKMLHPLIVPIIHQVAASKTISVAFAPSLPHLRAYLASYTQIRHSLPESPILAKPGQHGPMLAVYGMINLHRATTEYSVQGLSRSLAIAAEIADTWGMRLLVVEDSGDWESLAVEDVPGADSETLKDSWMEQVPLLNSSTIQSDDRIWAGRTVEIRAVLEKWCNVPRS